MLGLVWSHLEDRVTGNVVNIGKVFNGKVPCNVRCASLVKEKMQSSFEPPNSTSFNRVLLGLYALENLFLMYKYCKYCFS